jgi:lipid A ethanolaminephosphotransferase
MRSLTSSRLIILVSLFLLISGNLRFFQNILVVFPLNTDNLVYLVSLAILSVSLTVFLLSLVCFRYTIKPVLILVLLMSSSAAYFMDTYNVVIDHVMIDNILRTDTAEAMDLLSLRQVLYLILLGIIPSLLIYKLRISQQGFKKALLSRLLLMVTVVGLMVANILVFGNFYASFFREHKTLRFHANPSYYIYSVGKYLGTTFKGDALVFTRLGLDAFIPAEDIDRELLIFVVGETARADHFSLNGYARQTNPLLEKEELISFQNFWACGTSTAVSVPCMFSLYSRSDYEKSEAEARDNVLDVMQRAGVNVLWLDNNSDSKSVASRVPYVNYKSADINPVCDDECRDIGLLANLQDYIDKQKEGDIFIILHQMGNHGPAYYKRYPPAFEKFKPTCQTNQLEECSVEEINNSYDNAILYTDYFLSETIKLLAKNSGKYETAMFYVSDHGESLGENNVYLHGLPYMIAPDAQKHVPMIMWFSEKFATADINYDALKASRNTEFSHDNLSHTILGLLEVDSIVYDKEMDMIEHKELD